MRSLIFSVLALFTAAAGASTSFDTVVATQVTCSQIQAGIQEKGALAVRTDLGEVVAFANAKSCWTRGYIYTKFESVRAADRWCQVGHICDANFGGM